MNPFLFVQRSLGGGGVGVPPLFLPSLFVFNPYCLCGRQMYSCLLDLLLPHSILSGVLVTTPAVNTMLAGRVWFQKEPWFRIRS